MSSVRDITIMEGLLPGDTVIWTGTGTQMSSFPGSGLKIRKTPSPNGIPIPGHSTLFPTPHMDRASGPGWQIWTGTDGTISSTAIAIQGDRMCTGSETSVRASGGLPFSYPIPPPVKAMWKGPDHSTHWGWPISTRMVTLIFSQGSRKIPIPIWRARERWP